MPLFPLLRIECLPLVFERVFFLARASRTFSIKVSISKGAVMSSEAPSRIPCIDRAILSGLLINIISASGCSRLMLERACIVPLPLYLASKNTTSACVPDGISKTPFPISAVSTDIFLRLNLSARVFKKKLSWNIIRILGFIRPSPESRPGNIY